MSYKPLSKDNYSNFRNDFVNAIRCNTKMSAPEKSTAYALCRRMHNETGRLCVTLKALAIDSGLGVRTIQKAIKSLEDASWVEVERGPKGSHKTNSYKLHIVEAADWNVFDGEEGLTGCSCCCHFNQY